RQECRDSRAAVRWPCRGDRPVAPTPPRLSKADAARQILHRRLLLQQAQERAIAAGLVAEMAQLARHGGEVARRQRAEFAQSRRGRAVEEAAIGGGGLDWRQATAAARHFSHSTPDASLH